MHRFKTTALAGFMGAGKSTLGKALADRAGTNFRDLDDIIVEREGMEIPRIFEERGESYFRTKEAEYLKDVLQRYDGILALGGGTLQDSDLIKQIKALAILLFLDTPFSVIFERLKHSRGRPLLLDENGQPKPEDVLKADISELYNERLSNYRQAHIIYTPDPAKSPREQASRIYQRIKAYVSEHSN